ncbi:MAG: CoA-binding protein [Planctomycetota bacterium]
MTAAISRRAVDEFLAQKTLALAGASRRGRKFGNAVLKELTKQGYEVLVVHPEAAEIDGAPCYRSLAALPKPVGGLVAVVPPSATAQLVAEAAEAGIPRIWMQQGAESPDAIRSCAEHGIDAVHGECILMFAEPAGFVHRAHRWIRKVCGKLPA